MLDTADWVLGLHREALRRYVAGHVHGRAGAEIGRARRHHKARAPRIAALRTVRKSVTLWLKGT